MASSGDDPSASTSSTRLRSVSTASNKLFNTSMRLLDADVPNGMWSATAQKTAQAPTLTDIREARYTTDRVDKDRIPEEKDDDARQQENEKDILFTEQKSRLPVVGASEPVTDNGTDDAPEEIAKTRTRTDLRDLSRIESSDSLHLTTTGRYPNGYKFPPKHTWQQSLRIGSLAFLSFLKTPLGILLLIYGLNVVAWGAMIFFLLIGAASNTMCTVQRPYDSGHYVHDCNDLYSPRRIWIEVDSQVLTALFCVTAFGLVPWRFRDLFFLLKWRFLSHKKSLRRLAAWHRSWFRLQGSDQLDVNLKAGCHDIQYNMSALPEPPEKAPDIPLTGHRAPPTATWKMDFVVWSAAFNTFFQIVLCYYMWAMNRFTRPSWATGFFVAVGCVSAGLGGVMQFVEGKKIKKIEGIPLEVGQSVEEVVERDASERV